VAKILIENKADINATERDVWTPLHVAAYLGNEEVVRLLIQNKAEINARNMDNKTPLELAIFRGNETTAAMLSDFGGK
jgi:ankyrin repeat protein